MEPLKLPCKILVARLYNVFLTADLACTRVIARLSLGFVAANSADSVLGAAFPSYGSFVASRARASAGMRAVIATSIIKIRFFILVLLFALLCMPLKITKFMLLYYTLLRPAYQELFFTQFAGSSNGSLAVPHPIFGCLKAFDCSKMRELRHKKCS